MSSEIIIGGTSLGGIIFSIKLAWNFWKRRKELLELAAAAGVKLKGDMRKWIKGMRRILKNWIKVIDLNASIEQKEVKGILAQTFKQLIKSPDVMKETATMMSSINDIYTLLKEGIKEITDKPDPIRSVQDEIKKIDEDLTKGF